MKKKEQYINVFLDGYFTNCHRSNTFGMTYYYLLSSATEEAEKEWKKIKKINKQNKKILAQNK